MKTLFLLFYCFLLSFSMQAVEIPVSPETFLNHYINAADGDVLLLSEGFYGNDLPFPSEKTITLKAESGSVPVFSGSITGNTSINNGSLIFDGVAINRNENYLLNADIGTIDLIAFRNLSIQNIGRCLIRTNNTGCYINNLEIENCIVTDCGANGYNFIYPKHVVKSISVKNSTLYNYTNGESFFFPNTADQTNVFRFLFENNTVYKWAKSSDRAICNTGNKYHGESNYTFRNNIVCEPGVAGQVPKMINVSSGTVIAEHNLLVNYGGYAGGTQTINDLTLTGLGLQDIGFPDPLNGYFNILSTSPLAVAGTNGNCVGDPRWIKNMLTPVNLSTTVYPEGAGRVTPASSVYESGALVTVTASRNFGYLFKEWQVNGTQVSTDLAYSFTIQDDIEVVAVFDPIATYSLEILKSGDGANWGKLSLSPEPVDGRYEEGSWVTITVVPNSVTSFLYWDDQTTETTKTIQVNQNIQYTAHFDWIPFIVGWDFAPAEPRGDRPGDYYSHSDNTGVLNLFKGDGSKTNWGGSTKNVGGVSRLCARRYTDFVDMDTSRYFEAEFSVKDREAVKYSSITIKSLIAADNDCVHKIQKMQYATDQLGPYYDLNTIDISPYYNTQWVACNATLELTEEMKNKSIYIRWTGDPSGGLIGTPSSNSTEGFYLADVFVFAEQETVEDHEPPVLLASLPGKGNTTVSANGSVVLTFNEKVKAGKEQGIVSFNGSLITPVIANRTVTYSYSGLSYGTSYDFTIPEGTITDMSGNEYAGTTIPFATMSRPQPAKRVYDAVVDINGTGDYTTIQQAIDNAPASRSIPWLIFIKNGSYREVVHIPESKPFIHLIGQDKEKTIIHEKINSQGTPDPSASWYQNDLAAWPYSVNNPESPMAVYKSITSGAVVKVNAPDFYAENISFINDWGVEAQNGPMALAMYSNNDRIAFYNCDFRSYQDTWQTSSRNTNDRLYAYHCWIEGAVDYFYGAGNAFVDECTLYNVRSGAVIIAGSHKVGTKWGYVFNNCIVDGNTAASDGKLRLGRPWHNAPKAVFLNTKMKIRPHAEGWTNMGTAPGLYAEYNSMDEGGNPIDLSKRKTSYTYKVDGIEKEVDGLQAVLSSEEAAQYTYTAVLVSPDNWNPRSFHELTLQAQNLQISQSNILTWDPVDYAICYIVMEGEEVVGFSKETSFLLPAGALDKEMYSIYPVNEYGSLGVRSEKVSKGNSGLTKPFSDKDGPKITTFERKLVIKDIHSGTKIKLFTMEGKLLSTYISSSDIVETDPFPSGTYLVQIDSRFLKTIIQ